VIGIIFINSVMIGVLVSGITFACARIAAGAATRFALWYGAFIATAVLPLFALLLKPNIIVSGGRGHAPQGGIGGLVLVWSALATLQLLRLAIAFVRMRRGLRVAVVDQRASALARSISEELHNRRQFEIVISCAVSSPQIIGLLRPVIALPTSVDTIDSATLRAILLHEIAHIRRGDDWLLALERLGYALFFFNPSLWFIKRQIAFERELACDEMACARVDAWQYAEAILPVARSTAAAWSLGAVNTALERRTIRLLTRQPPQPRWPDVAAVVLAVIGVVLGVVSSMPYIARPTRITPAATHRIDPAVPEDLAEAATDFVSGRSMMGVGRYDLAIAELTRSFHAGYERRASALNLAVAYRLAGDLAASATWEKRAAGFPESTY
jgi:hypothetical protein